MKNIAEILKNAPKGFKLYTPLCGECHLSQVGDDWAEAYHSLRQYIVFDEYGRYEKSGELLLFPSSEHRSWENWQEVLMPQCVGSVFVDNNEYQYCLVTNDKIWVIDKLRKSLTEWFTFSEFNFNQELRFATAEETKQCFKELDKQGYKFEDGEVVKKEKEWSIFDAKDGDFVYDIYNETIFIFKEINSQKALMEYVSYPTPLDFSVQVKSNGNQHSTLGNYYDEKKYRLATTEEVQLLLRKLNDAGYKFENGEVSKKETNDENKWSILDAKDGDFIFDIDNGGIFIFRGFDKDIILRYASNIGNQVYVGPTGNYCTFEEGSARFRPATDDEILNFLEKMKEAGYHWNPITNY